jgi:aromatic amino acid aminotransferase I / 2-aminoadipate transaminase
MRRDFLLDQQFWLRVDPQSHPDRSQRSLVEIEEEIFNSCISKGVLVARGSWFRTEPEVGPQGELFFRATYAAASEFNINEAIRRFGMAVRESFGMA